MKKKMGLISHSLKMRKARGSRRPHSTQLGVGHELLLLYTFLPVCATSCCPMKRISLIFAVLFSSLGHSLAQTNYYSLVTNHWFQGNHETVLELANHRLAANTNDIAGWITRAEYSLTFEDASSLSNILSRTLEIGSNVTSSAFSSVFAGMTESFVDMLDFVATYHPTPEEQAEDARKAHVSGKPFLYSDYLEALERDGFFANDPPMGKPQTDPPGED